MMTEETKATNTTSATKASSNKPPRPSSSCSSCSSTSSSSSVAAASSSFNVLTMLFALTVLGLAWALSTSLSPASSSSCACSTPVKEEGVVKAVETEAEAVSHMGSPLLSLQHIVDYQRDGHVLIRNQSRDDILAVYPHVLEAKLPAEKKFFRFALKKMNCSEESEWVDDKLTLPVLEECSGRWNIPIPYIQYLYLDKENEQVAKFVRNPRLGYIAAHLMQCNAVRVYAVAAFFKGIGRSILNQNTGLHADMHMTPIDTNNFITMWCPLRRTTKKQSILSYVSGSHHDASFLYWFNNGEPVSGAKGYEADLDRYPLVDYEWFEPGDCAWHSGWVFHSATFNESDEERRVIAVSFVDADAKLLDGNQRQMKIDDELMWRDWIDDVYENKLSLDHPLLPQTYRKVSSSPAGVPPLLVGRRGQAT